MVLGLFTLGFVTGVAFTLRVIAEAIKKQEDMEEIVRGEDGGKIGA
jgi:hypothetical protein